MAMSTTDSEVWQRLVVLCHRPYASGIAMSNRRQRAVVAADYLIRRYEQELRRIAAHPEHAQAFAKDALEL